MDKSLSPAFIIKQSKMMSVTVAYLGKAQNTINVIDTNRGWAVRKQVYFRSIANFSVFLDYSKGLSNSMIKDTINNI